MHSAVFLDRDNTLIANDGDLGEPEQVRLLEGVAEGLRALRDAGYRLIVVTNQGGVARGLFSEEDVDSVHQRIASLVHENSNGQDVINRFYYCPYHPEGTVEQYRRDHPWRKPSPGMLLRAAEDLDLDLAASWMVGDQTRDVEAGRAAGCRTVLVTRDETLVKAARPTMATATFGGAVQAILNAETIPEPMPEHGAAKATTTSTSPTASAPGDLGDLRRAIIELTDELRSERVRRSEFTAFRLAAGMCQLLAVLLALLGLLQLDTSDVFFRWMIGAAMVQLLTIVILLLDLKG